MRYFILLMVGAFLCCLNSSSAWADERAAVDRGIPASSLGQAKGELPQQKGTSLEGAALSKDMIPRPTLGGEPRTEPRSGDYRFYYTGFTSTLSYRVDPKNLEKTLTVGWDNLGGKQVSLKLFIQDEKAWFVKDDGAFRTEYAPSEFAHMREMILNYVRLATNQSTNGADVLNLRKIYDLIEEIEEPAPF